jgi:TnpA family transposase
MNDLNYQRHLHILDTKEIKQLYALPIFDQQERILHFDLNEQEQLTMQAFRGLSSKVVFILQLGYFKASHQFFSFEFEVVNDDVKFILQRYFPQVDDQLLIAASKPTRLNQQRLIRQMTGFRLCDAKAKNALFKKAEKLADLHSDPVFIFRSLFSYLEVNKIILPAYSFLQRHIISKALSAQQKRLEELLAHLLTDQNKELLDQLLKPHQVGKVSFYLLTFLQQEPSDFQYQQMKRQLERKNKVKILYELAQRVFGELDISNENIKYYGALAEYYSIYKLNRMEGEIRYLYLLCFTYKRYHYINDTLIEAIRYHVRNYEKEVELSVGDHMLSHKMKGHKYMDRVPLVLQLFTDPDISNQTPFIEVKNRAFQSLNPDELKFVSKFIEKENLDKKQLKWDFYSSLGRKLSLNLRPLILNLTFESTSSNSSMLSAVHWVQKTFQAKKNLKQIPEQELPLDFIAESMLKYLKGEDQQICPTRYEFFLYQGLRNQIESGEIFIPESNQFKSFDQDLIERSTWEKEQSGIIQKLDLPKLKQPIEDLLTEWEQKIERRYKRVNDRLKRGEIENVKITGKNKDGSLKWHLNYTSSSEPSNHRLYDQFTPIGIIPLLHLVNEHTHFLDAFEHILNRSVSRRVQKDRAVACILANATNYGIGKIATISDMNYEHLAATAHNFMRLEPLQQANKRIIDKTMKLPMFEFYNVEDNIHSSSDGQKYGTQFHTLNSRYSPKYFGLSKGVTANTLTINNIPVNAKIIGANEHESHHVFDLLYNNISDLDPDIHSTDTHGTNRVNFAILDLFGYQFAPRYKQVSSDPKFIYSFQHPAHYNDYVLKPIRKIDKALIIEECNNIQRIMASLALKTTTQSTLVKKLATYPRNNRTRKALAEYDAIVKTDFMLRYIDSPSFQQSIQLVLNRSESMNKLRKHIFHAHGGKFRVHSMVEQQVYGECNRLVANAIIYYNTLLLSELLAQKQKSKDYQAVERIKKVSPIAWRNTHIHGKYQFLIDQNKIKISNMIKNVKI